MPFTQTKRTQKLNYLIINNYCSQNHSVKNKSNYFHCFSVTQKIPLSKLIIPVEFKINKISNAKIIQSLGLSISKSHKPKILIDFIAKPPTLLYFTHNFFI